MRDGIHHGIYFAGSHGKGLNSEVAVGDVEQADSKEQDGKVSFVHGAIIAKSA